VLVLLGARLARCWSTPARPGMQLWRLVWWPPLRST